METRTDDQREGQAPRPLGEGHDGVTPVVSFLL